MQVDKVQVTRRKQLTGPALIRLLDRLTDIDVAAPRQAFASRVSEWLSWTHAISLSAALEGATEAGGPSHPEAAKSSADAAEQDFLRVRNHWVKSIATDSPSAPNPTPAPAPHVTPVGSTPSSQALDFKPFHRHYVERQDAMEASVAALRGRLRKTLATRSPDLARLAAVDAVMEEALGARERSLLAALPVWLERHFMRLQQADHEAAIEAMLTVDGCAPVGSDARVRMFCHDMRAVLLAELDVRLQPVEGLLQALRNPAG